MFRSPMYNYIVIFVYLLSSIREISYRALYKGGSSSSHKLFSNRKLVKGHRFGKIIGSETLEINQGTLVGILFFFCLMDTTPYSLWS
jgi:hypothetical protein